MEEYAGRMNEPLAIHIFGKVLSAVVFMHRKQILHRDIKGQFTACSLLLDLVQVQIILSSFKCCTLHVWFLQHVQYLALYSYFDTQVEMCFWTTQDSR